MSVFAPQLVHPFYRLITAFRRYRTLLVLLIFTLLSIGLTVFIMMRLYQQVSASPLTPQQINQPIDPSSVLSTKAEFIDEQAKSTSVATSIHTPQKCVPDTTYSAPGLINLSGKDDGVTVVKDPTAFYQIYGNTAHQLQQQVQQCAPKTGEGSSEKVPFAGQTGYSISTQYTWNVGDDGYCHVLSAKVGLHLSMALPYWQSNAYAAGGLSAAWQTYIKNLTTHENGHMAIDQQYASQLLSDLQSFPATDCSSMEAATQARITSEIAALNAANDAYDARTNHGATQGAVMP